ncbi:MAG: TonB-dependent receptor [Colwellia sp.]|nr:TonB-dependent receptor [Colwellia sp.]MCW9081359.1 TonB-dependent receptor [Colwellia sp.]
MMLKNNALSLAISSALCLGTIYNNTAIAQDAVSVTEKENKKESQKNEVIGLEVITVTARKKEESLQSTPVAVSVIGADELKSRNVLTMADVVGVPNVSISGATSPAYANIAIRGIGSTNTDPFQAPAVAVLTDGIYHDTVATALSSLIDVESVEILRGPQGTLFGRNSPAGVINIKSRRPSGDTSLDAQLSLENNSTLDTRVAFEFPISDDFSGRIAVMKRTSDGAYERKDSDGFTDPIVYSFVVPLEVRDLIVPDLDPTDNQEPGEVDTLFTRGILQYKPSDELTVSLIAEYIDSKGSLLGSNNNSSETSTLGRLGFSAANTEDGDPYTTETDLSASQPWDKTTVSLEVLWDLTDNLQLTSITAYREEELYNTYDVDSQNKLWLHSNQIWETKQITQELRLDSKFDGPFNFTVGSFFMDSNLYKDQETYVNFALIACALSPAEVDCQNDFFIQSNIDSVVPDFNEVDQNTLSWAIFGQFYYDINDRTRLSVGGRYSVDEKDMFVSFDAGELADPEEGFPITVKDDWDNFSPTIGLDYELADDKMIYFSVSEAFRSGGFNGRASSLESFQTPYEEETATSYELGYKSTLLDNHLRLNLTAFYTAYDQIQREITIGTTSNVGVENVVLNAADAKIKGIEFESTYLITDGLTLTANLSHQSGEYTDFNPNLRDDQIAIVDADAFKDFDLPLAPEWSSFVALDYIFELESMGWLTLNINHAYTSEQVTNTIPTDGSSRDSVQMVNASIKWDINDSFSIRLFGKNLLDEQYKLMESNFGIFGSAVTYSEPVSYGLTVSYSYY